MNIAVIDGQGGKIGKLLIEGLKSTFPSQSITAIGTNSTATAAMLKAGAEYGATGENPVAKIAKWADIIIGPIGIIIADSLLGEVTPTMAASIGSSDAYKILIPMNRCNHYVVGVSERSLSEYITFAIQKVSEIMKSH